MQGFLVCLTFQFFCATVMMGYKPDQHAIPSWFLSSEWIAACLLQLAKKTRVFN